MPRPARARIPADVGLRGLASQFEFQVPDSHGPVRQEHEGLFPAGLRRQHTAIAEVRRQCFGLVCQWPLAEGSAASVEQPEVRPRTTRRPGGSRVRPSRLARGRRNPAEEGLDLGHSAESAAEEPRQYLICKQLEGAVAALTRDVLAGQALAEAHDAGVGHTLEKQALRTTPLGGRVFELDPER